MWAWMTGRLGRGAGGHVDAAGRRAWQGLCGYMRGQAIVAAVDAIAIGIGIFVLGVPFALPLAILTFFAGFFPIVGAVTAGALAVLVALAAEGPVTALILLGVVVAVQQLEGNLLEPLVMGRAVHLHPVVILLSLAAGAAVAGIVGAFLAVPLAAAGTAAGSYLWSRIGPEDQGDQPSAAVRGDLSPPDHHG
jgi:predicted PurR-regulated permease PerM